MRLYQILESRIDNKNGAGAVPDNQEVDYFGKKVAMTPRMFLKLAKPLQFDKDVEKTILGLMDYMKQGNKIGSPFFGIKLPGEWFDGNFDTQEKPRVMNHEGRHRMYALQSMDGNNPVEVHLFFRGGVRARDITPEIMAKLNEGILNEEGRYVSGPLFN